MPARERPSFVTLVDWIEGRLTGEEAAEVDAAVAENPATHRAVLWLRRFHHVAANAPLHSPPPVVRQRLNQLFARRRAGRLPRREPGRVWDAELQYDSRRDRQLAGVRTGPEHSTTLHLAYASEVADVVLDLFRAGSGARIEGQVLLAAHEADYPIFTAIASGPESEVLTIEGDAKGRFQLLDVPSDVNRLRVDNGELAVSFPIDIAGEW